MKRLGIAAAALLMIVPPLAHAAYPGVRPKALFGTPGKAAYCSVEPRDQEDWWAELFCWTPNDGWAVWISWNARRAATGYFTRPPRIVHGRAVLKDYKPRAPVLSFGEQWRYRCDDPGQVDSCGGREGVVAFTCKSRSSGLTCTNAARHGFWIGRFRGYRLF